MVPGTAVPPEPQERPSPAAVAAGNALAAAAAATVAGNDALLQANGGNADDAEPAIQNNVIMTALNTNFTRRQAETLKQSGTFPDFNEYSTSQVNLGLIYIMLILGKQ